MMQAGQAKQLTDEQFDAIAWRFLCSEYAEHTYQDWPIDRRLEAFLQHQGLARIADDGAAYPALLERVMANFPRARRDGVLQPPHS
jgi:hypothetical protein